MNYEIMPVGIHWPDVDEDLGVAGMLKGQRAKAAERGAAERGTIDDVMPHATRPRIARALAMLRGKTVEMPGRKHDNLPV